MLSGRFKILNKIDSGGYGMVYKGINVRTEEPVAIKIMNKKDEIIFRNECLIYKTIGNSTDFPKLKWILCTEKYYILVITLYGKTLLTTKKTSISENTLLDYTSKMFEKTILLHEKGILHRDIKTSNFVFNRKDEDDDEDTDIDDTIFLLDFSLSTFCYDNTGNIKPNKGIDKIIGSKKFCSIHIHNKQTPSFRDDLESVCYVVCDLINIIDWVDVEDETIIKERKLYLHNNIKIPWLKTLFGYIKGLSYESSMDIESFYNIISKN